MRVNSTANLEDLRRSILACRDPSRPVVAVCNGRGCGGAGAVELITAFRQELAMADLSDLVEVKAASCYGLCSHGPVAVVYPEGIFYQQVAESNVPEIVHTTLLNGGLVERLLYVDPATHNRIVHKKDIPFYQRQMRVLLGENELMDPTSIEDYIAAGGYAALAKVLAGPAQGMSREQVIEEVKRSGLRGRGGAGFPTWRKWQACLEHENDQKYVICNADEGNPGAFMDGKLLEGNPHSIIEGMIIGGYAVGAGEGYVYVRHEYPLAIKHTTIAIRQAEQLGLLGDNIFGSPFSFRLHVTQGGGAYVCGESTALVASIEGRTGEPRAKHTHLAASGLWGKPTVLNNVKSWASIPVIINKGADWHAQIGTETSKGTMIFSLVGKLNNTGLVEVPMGTTLREMVFDIGGGIPNGKRFKAVQPGGPSGGILPEEYLDVPVDYEAFSQVGAMMGSGGMIVMDEDICMVDLAKYFLEFCEFESCGKCTACREGVKRMLELLSRITAGEGEETDIDRLEVLANVVADASLCGLGQTAPSPVLTTLRYFRPEYEAHVREKRCPAGVCRDLISYHVASHECIGCGECHPECPTGAIVGQLGLPHSIDQSKCTRCGDCRVICRSNAVRIGSARVGGLGYGHVHA